MVVAVWNGAVVHLGHLGRRGSTMFLVKNSLRPKIQKVLPHFITPALGLGMGICEWGKVEFFNFGWDQVGPAPVKGPE